MLKAFKSELLNLSNQDNKKFYSRIKKNVPFEEISIYNSKLTSFIISIPQMLIEIQKSYKTEINEKTKNLYGFLLTYLYHPNDFISEEDSGLLGYLDDAYLIGLVYQHNSSDEPKYFTEVDEWLSKTRKVIPNVTKKIDELFSELINGNYEAFNEKVMSLN